MKKFKGTKIFEFEQFGISWKLGLTYSEVVNLIKEGVKIEELK